MVCRDFLWLHLILDETSRLIDRNHSLSLRRTLVFLCWSREKDEHCYYYPWNVLSLLETIHEKNVDVDNSISLSSNRFIRRINMNTIHLPAMRKIFLSLNIIYGQMNPLNDYHLLIFGIILHRCRSMCHHVFFFDMNDDFNASRWFFFLLVCPIGTFKSTAGNDHPCQKCPPNSYTKETGSTVCICRSGFFRLNSSSLTSACIGEKSIFLLLMTFCHQLKPFWFFSTSKRTSKHHHRRIRSSIGENLLG